MKIAILGYGVVGKGVEILAKENSIDVKYILMRDVSKLYKETMTKKLDDILNDSEVECVVECIGGDRPAYDYVLAALKAKKNVVTSNKKMLVKHFEELFKVAKEEKVKLLFSAACGGGIPWIKELMAIKDEEEVYAYKGIMNGTSNYILDKMYKENSDFEVALKKAQELGYAERDPSDDIDGVDTANKVILSAGVAFDTCFKLEDVFVKGIRYFDLEDLNYVKENGYRIVLLGKGLKKEGKYSLSVIPTMVKKESVLGNISDNYNCFKLESKNLSNLIFIGQGAGSLPTASNVLRDIKALDSPCSIELKCNDKPDYDLYKATYYIRTKNVISDYVKEKINDYTYISEPITINVLKTLISDGDFVAEVSEDD